MDLDLFFHPFQSTPCCSSDPIAWLDRLPLSSGLVAAGRPFMRQIFAASESCPCFGESSNRFLRRETAPAQHGLPHLRNEKAP